MSEIKIQSNEIKLVHLDQIKLNPDNYNAHDQEQIEQAVQVLKYQGFRRPGTISNRTGFLVCGELRYLAMKRAGMTHMPVMYQDYDSKDQEIADGIADNALAKQSFLDMAKINFDLPNLGPFDPVVLGIKDFKIDPFDKSPEIKTEKQSKLVECPGCGLEFEK